MFDTFEVVYSILLFVAIYFQVFFLNLFFQQRKSPLENLEAYPDHTYPPVSFLIPCWNEEKTVANTINSILAVDYPKEKLKIYIIDDGSSDKTWEEMLRFKNHPQIEILQKENGGKHTALNMALDYVKTGLIVSFDADTKINPGALKKAVNYFLEDKELMALAGTMLIDNPKTFVQKAQNIEYQTFSFTKKMLGSIGGVWAAPGAFSVFRREVFEKIGKYKKAHNLEDVELTIRLQEARMKIGHCHTAFAYTKGPDSLKKLFCQRLRWCYGGINNMKDYRHMIFNKKYGHFGFLTLPMNIFNYILVIFVFSLGLYRIGLFINQKILEFSVFGWKNIVAFDWDYFFISFKPTFFLAIITGIFILSAIYFGKKISLIKKWEITHILYFIIIYGLLAPVWIIKSLYKTLFFKNLSWR